MAVISVARGRSGEAAPWIEVIARFGFIAKAVLYGTIGALAALAAVHRGGGTTDTRGAMAPLVGSTSGRVLLGGMAIGLLGYALWRLIEGLLDPERRGTGLKALAVRASFIVRGMVHALLGYTAARFALGARGGGAGGGEQGREATRTAFQLPAGEALVWGAALCVAGYGLYQLYRAAAAKLGKQLDTATMSRQAGHWVVGLSRFGIAARGLVFIALGWTLTLAARRHDASETGGLREALDAIRELGRWPFLAVAVGLIAYGIFQLLNARYRRIRVRS